MPQRVKELVDEYEEWHLSTVGAYSTDWIIDQHENADLDEDDEDHRGEEADEDKQDRLWEEDDIDSEPESLSDVLTCKPLAEDELSNRGLDNYDVIRHIDTWDAQLIKSFAKTGDVSTLPRVSDSIRRLVGQNVLIYEIIVDQKERLTMTRSELMEAGFAVAAVVKGEAGNSTRRVQSVQLVTQTGVDLPPARVIDVLKCDISRSPQFSPKRSETYADDAGWKP